MVDPHAEILVKVACPIIPPCISSGLRVMEAVGIVQALAAEKSEGFALGFGNMCPPMACADIPNIDILRRDIEVAAKHKWSAGVGTLVEPTRQAIEPQQLGL